MPSSSTTTSSSNNVSISIFQGRFILQKLLGKGGFGQVYSGVQTSNQQPVAVKMQRKADSNSFLFHQARVMQDIQRRPASDGLPGIATLKYFGQQGDFRMLIMTLQGTSLEDIHQKRERFNLKTTVMLADQMISRLQYIHNAGYVHRDLKPDNFLVGRLTPKRIYIVDFGLSYRLWTQDGQLRQMATGKSFVGTSRYASLRTHRGISQSRRDDIQQLVYVMIYMYRGRLPWSGLSIKNRDQKQRVIGQRKGKLDPTQICVGCPRQFADLLFYARNMSFSETPKYDMCRVLMKSVLDEMDPPQSMDYEFEWLLPDKVNSSTATATTTTTTTTTTAMQAQGKDDLHVNTRTIKDNAILDNQQQNTNNLEGTINSPDGVGAANALLSDAKGQGMFSGFGSGARSQNIMSLGEKS